MAGPGNPDKAPVGADFVIPVLGAAFAVYYLTTVWDLPWEAKANGIILGSALLALVVVFLIVNLARVAEGAASLSLRRLTDPPRFLNQRLGLIVLMVVFIAVIPYLGFTLTVLGFLFAAMLLLGVRSPVKLVAVSVGAALAGYLLFIALLGTPFPHGPIETLLGHVI